MDRRAKQKVWGSKMSLDYHEMDMQLASANDKVKELEEKLQAKMKEITAHRVLAQKQRDNMDLWKPPMTSFGHELQMALRELHIAILEIK